MKTLLILIFLNLTFILGLKAETIFLTHNLQGQTFIDENGELRGKEHAGKRAFNIELVRAMMEFRNVEKKIAEIPFPRGYKMLQELPNIAFFNLSRTDIREKHFKWVGPLQKEKDYFYQMKASQKVIKTLKDAKAVKAICVLNGGIHHKILKREGFKNIVPNISYKNCFKMLKESRVDLTVSALSTLDKKLQSARIDPETIVQTDLILLESEGYIAFSKETRKSEIVLWQMTLDKLKNSGEYQKIYEKYFLPK